MEKAITKYFWIFNLLALAGVAFFSATGAGEIIASTLSASLPQAQAEEQSSTDRSATRGRSFASASRDGTDILRRNIFDSVTGPIIPSDDLPMDAPRSTEDGDLPLVPCPSGQAKLLATIADPRDPEWSFANIEQGGTKNLYRIGDELDGRTLSSITWRYITLRGNSDECYIDMFGDQKAPTKARTSSPSSGKIEDNIQVDGEFERTVDRSLVDQALANPTMFARSVRVRPYKKNGEVTGFRLRRIQKGSPLEMLGAQKGDIIHSVNGVELTSVDQALTAYQSLRNDNKLTFSITRAGKPVDLNINIK